MSLLLAIVSGNCLGATDGVTETIGDLIREGQKVTLVAEVDGGKAPFVYQWYKNGAPIPDAANSTIRFESFQPGDAGAYVVLVSNSGGSLASLPLFLAFTSAAISPTTPVVPGPKPGHLGNVSLILSIEDKATVGFTLGGSNTSGATRVLVRAAGPALAQFGIAGALQDPVLTVSDETRLIASNDDWAGARVLVDAASAVGAFPFVPASKDSALVLDLPTARYTAQVSDRAGTAGTTLVEIYDTTPQSSGLTPRLVSISARGSVGFGGGKVVAGFTIEGETPVKVLVRAVGPGLVRLGASGVLENPRLTLGQESGVFATNEKWSESDAGAAVATAAAAVGTFALADNSLDAALLVTLEPGAYTAQVTPAKDGRGVALLEVYEVP